MNIVPWETILRTAHGATAKDHKLALRQFVDTEHLKAYAPHPAHQWVSEELQRISQRIIDFDIEDSRKAEV
jgi:hypothetical protein